MKIFLLFYMCHFAMSLTHCYKTAVFYIYICSFSTKFNYPIPAFDAPVRGPVGISPWHLVW